MDLIYNVFIGGEYLTELNIDILRTELLMFAFLIRSLYQVKVVDRVYWLLRLVRMDTTEVVRS